jgi:hypothetical protein
VVTIIRDGANGNSKSSWIFSIICSRQSGSYRNWLVLLCKTSSCERAELAFDVSVVAYSYRNERPTFRLAKGILHFSFLRHYVDFDMSFGGSECPNWEVATRENSSSPPAFLPLQASPCSAKDFM